MERLTPLLLVDEIIHMSDYHSDHWRMIMQALLHDERAPIVAALIQLLAIANDPHH